MAASAIEEAFSLACQAAGLKVEAEQMVGRYRPDFLIREHKVIVELDGAENHSSPEDRTRDVQRQRYLQKLGWTVLRFTGREIHGDAPACVAEVIEFIEGLDIPAPDYAVYIDWLFFQRAVIDFERRHTAHLTRQGTITRDTFLQILPRVIPMPDAVEVHLFGAASTFSTSSSQLETSRLLSDGKRRFLIEEHQADFLAVNLLDHLKAHRPVYQDRVVLVADDGAYPPEFMDNDPHLAALVRRGESQSRMLTVRAAKWQDIDYLFAPIAGVPLHEVV